MVGSPPKKEKTDSSRGTPKSGNLVERQTSGFWMFLGFVAFWLLLGVYLVASVRSPCLLKVTPRAFKKKNYHSWKIAPHAAQGRFVVLTWILLGRYVKKAEGATHSHHCHAYKKTQTQTDVTVGAIKMWSYQTALVFNKKKTCIRVLLGESRFLLGSPQQKPFESPLGLVRVQFSM